MGVLVSRSLSLKVSRAISDEELVRRVLAGDRWGREMLYRRHADSLLAMTVRLLANHGAAEGVVQETFVTAFEQLATLREPSAVRGWLRQIAVNLVRRRIRRGRLMRLLGLERGADQDATLQALADPGVSAEQRGELARIDRLLRGMKPAPRLAWMLRRVEGLELGEVACLCDCSLATVKRRIVGADAIVNRQGAVPQEEAHEDPHEEQRTRHEPAP
jgi:RNA polymerase sigma-70 factor (ECF subfamily)